MRGIGGTFREQLQLFATHGVFVSPHGAGLVNTMFMPPASGIVEIFPYHLDHNLYSTMAYLTGSANYPIHCVNGSIAWANDPVRHSGHATVMIDGLTHRVVDSRIPLPHCCHPSSSCTSPTTATT